MTEPMKVVVITGTPASGKTMIANRVAAKVRSSEVIHANDLIRSKGLFSYYARDGAMIANMGKLRKEIERLVKKSKKRVVIVEGHLLCDMRIENAIAVVIREHLAVLERRMKKRGYSDRKIKENIVSEAIDYCGINAQKNYSNVVEFMNEKSTANKIVSLINGMKKKREGIEMLDELVDFTKRKGWNA